MKIAAFTKYSYEGPSSRYRFYNYKNEFEKNNIKMDIFPLFEKDYFEAKTKKEKLKIVFRSYLKRYKQLKNLNSYDLVLIEYELFPFLPTFFEKKFKKRGIKYIVDYDDAIFHKYDMNSNFIVRMLLKNKIPEVIKNASYVIACNEYLENFAKKYNQNILRLPTVVLLHKYFSKMKNFQKNDEFIIGWIGSKSTSKYIVSLLPVFNRLIKKYPDIKINLVGSDESLLKNPQEYNINIIKWSEESEVDEILKFDVGIMPLDDTPWSRGKCGFKLIQYMSCKKPVVASAVGINKEIVRDNGFLANGLDEWYNALETLYLNKKMREEMGEKGFERVLEDFNFDKNVKKYINLLKEIG